MSTPVAARKDIIGDLIYGYVLIAREQDTHPDSIEDVEFGFQFLEGNGAVESEELYQ